MIKELAVVLTNDYLVQHEIAYFVQDFLQGSQVSTPLEGYLATKDKTQRYKNAPCRCRSGTKRQKKRGKK